MAEIIDLVAAACSVVFVLIGVFEIIEIFGWNSRSYGCTWHHYCYTYENAVMHNLSEGFLLIFCGIASCTFSLNNAVFGGIASYFGFMVYLTSRGCYFIFMGLYLLPNFCHDGQTWSSCMDQSTWIMVCTIASAAAVVVGIIMLVIGCTGRHTTGYYSGAYSGGQFIPMDWINILCIIASVCILALGIRNFANLPRSSNTAWWYQCLCRALLTSLMGAVSLFAALHSCPGVAGYFGFLYSWTGSGIFYILAGFYVMGDYSMYWNSRHDNYNNNIWLYVYYGAGALSVIVGIIKLIIRYCVGGGSGSVYYQNRSRVVTVQPIYTTTRVVAVQPVQYTTQPVVYTTQPAYQTTRVVQYR